MTKHDFWTVLPPSALVVAALVDVATVYAAFSLVCAAFLSLDAVSMNGDSTNAVAGPSNSRASSSPPSSQTPQFFLPPPGLTFLPLYWRMILFTLVPFSAVIQPLPKRIQHIYQVLRTSSHVSPFYPRMTNTSAHSPLLQRRVLIRTVHHPLSPVRMEFWIKGRGKRWSSAHRVARA
jgi:hypothetical protein